MRVLDRYLAVRNLAALVLILTLVLGLVLGIDLLMRLDDFLDGDLSEGTSRAGLLLRFVLYRLPAIASALLPLAAVGAALLTLTPMLRRNELVALAGSAVSMRVATRSLFAIAIAVGGLDLLLADQLAPRFETRLSAIEEQLSGDAQSGRVWTVPATGSDWYAHRARLGADHGPELSQVVIAPRDGRLVHADRLVHRREAETPWVLLRAVVTEVDADGSSSHRQHQELPCRGALALPFGAEELARRLTSRHAMTGPQLLARGDRLHLALAFRRWAQALVPLLAVACAVPVFARFENRDRLLVSAIRALAVAAIPMVVVAGGGLSADAGAWHPALTIGGALVLAITPAGLLYGRWRL